MTGVCVCARAHECVCSVYFFPHSFQAKELQTLHNLRKLFVQDLATRVKKVNYYYYCYSFGDPYGFF